MAKKKSARVVQVTPKFPKPPYEPAERPIFVNNVRVTRSESDWYIDVGVVPFDQILDKNVETVDFLVAERLVMSLATIKKLATPIEDVIDKSALQEIEESDA